MTDDNADNTHTRMPALPKPMLRSLFETPLEADTLRWMGDLLLLGSAIAWLALAMGMLLLQMQAPPALPWLESVAGSVILVVGWRFYSRRWVASAPVLIHTSTVFAFVVYALTQPFSLTLGQVWIVAWACAAASITTLAFGYLNSLFFVVSGSLVLNLIFQWFHPSADHPTLANLIGLAIASVVALITHGACFQLTRASTNARQLERLRSDMLVAFSTELSVPGNALDNLAHRPDLDEQVSAKLGVIGHQLNALAGFLANEARSAAPQTQPAELFSLADLLTLSTSQARRLASQFDIQTTLTTGPNNERLVLMPVHEIALTLAYLSRDAVLREDVRGVSINSRLETLSDERTYLSTLIKLDSDPETALHRGAFSAGHADNVAVRGLVYLIRATGGKLTLEPSGRRWQTAELWVPVQTNDYSTRTTHGAASGDSTALRDLQVLVVEDDELTRLLTARTLERMGAIVTVADTAASAVECLAAQAFDLVVADLHLPDTEGPALIAELRRHNSTVPIIVVTISSGAADVDELVLAGADHLLAKPLQFERLQQSVALLRISGRIRRVA